MGDEMFFRIVLFVWEFVLDLVTVMRMTDDEKDLEIMLLRQQLRIVERKQNRGPQIPRWQKVPLAALAVRLKGKASNAREAYGCSSLTPSLAGIGRWCDGNGLTSREENRGDHRLMRSWNTGFCRWRKITPA